MSSIMFTSGCLTAWKKPIGWSNCLRTLAYSAVVCSCHSAAPQMSAATIVSSAGMARRAPRRPSPGAAMTVARGDATSRELDARLVAGEVDDVVRVDRHAGGVGADGVETDAAGAACGRRRRTRPCARPGRSRRCRRARRRRRSRSRVTSVSSRLPRAVGVGDRQGSRLHRRRCARARRRRAGRRCSRSTQVASRVAISGDGSAARPASSASAGDGDHLHAGAAGALGHGERRPAELDHLAPQLLVVRQRRHRRSRTRPVVIARDQRAQLLDAGSSRARNLRAESRSMLLVFAETEISGLCHCVPRPGPWSRRDLLGAR